MEIRRLTPADYDEFFTLRLAALEEAPAAFATDAQAWREASRETIERLLIRSEKRLDMPILGAWIDGRLVGILGINRDLRSAIAHKATLWGFYVAAEYRQQRVGQALLDAMLKHAEQTPGLRQIRAVVNAHHSQEALTLLEAAGFKQYGREPAAKKVDDTFSDQVLIWYELNRPKA